MREKDEVSADKKNITPPRVDDAQQNGRNPGQNGAGYACAPGGPPRSTGREILVNVGFAHSANWQVFLFLFRSRWRGGKWRRKPRPQNGLKTG